MKNYRAFLRPFSFLTIRHKSGIFRNVIWISPGVASLIATVIILVFFPKINFFGEAGVLGKLTGFIQGLPGFYIAALAAIATFGSRSLNKVMPGMPPIMNIYFNGGVLVDEPLTRRLFLCSMFAYLTVLSFGLTFFGVMSQSTAGLLKLMLNESFWIVFKFSAVFAYLIFIFQMLFITLWGIAYLGERMHISDQE